MLDAWGAAGRPYREIADWLTGQHDLSNWWAQKLIVEYEQARGLRPPGVRPDGTFEVSASKTGGRADRAPLRGLRRREGSRAVAARTADEMKAHWRERMAALKTLLEG